MGRDGDTGDAANTGDGPNEGDGANEGTRAGEPVGGTKPGGSQDAHGSRQPARPARRVGRVRWVDYADLVRKGAGRLGLGYIRGDRRDRYNWPTVVASGGPGDHNWPGVVVSEGQGHGPTVVAGDSGEEIAGESLGQSSGDALSADALPADPLPTSLSEYRALWMARDVVGGSVRLPVAGATADAWNRSLRRFARVCVWALPAGAICLAVGTARGWPTAAEPNGGSGGSWLVLTIHGLALAVIGVVALMGLVAATRGRWMAAVAVLGTVSGAVLLAPVLALIGLARPSAWRLGMAAETEASVLDSAASRWLAGAGVSLLALGWVAAAGAILASGILSRTDGAMVLASAAAGVLATITGWQFLIIIATMLLLAAALGICWTASHLSAEGLLRPGRVGRWRESVRVPGPDDHRPG